MPGFPKGEVYLHDAKSRSAGVKIKVKSFLNHESDSVKVRSNSVVFTSQAAASSVEDVDESLGKVELPESFKSGVLLFIPKAKDQEAAVHLIDDSFASFPAGAIKVVNLSPDPMRIELEGKPFDCDAGAALVIKDPPVGDRYASGMRAYRKKDGDWVQVMSGVWSHPGKKRVIQIITINPVIQGIEIKGVRDISSPLRR